MDEDKQMEKVSVNFDNSSRIDVYVFFNTIFMKFLSTRDWRNKDGELKE